MSESGLILGPNSSPFRSDAAASDHLRKKGMSPERYMIIAHLGGWALVDCHALPDDLYHLNAAGKPFASQAEAARTRDERELSADRWKIVEMRPGGYGLLDTPQVPNHFSPNKAQATAPARRPIEYCWVTFEELPMGSTEPPVVTLSHVGMDLILQLQRGERVPLPKPMLEVADQTTHTRFTHTAGYSRKVAARVRRYRYSVHPEPCTRADFEAYVKRGRKAVREAAEKPPEQTQSVMAAGASA